MRIEYFKDRDLVVLAEDESLFVEVVKQIRKDFDLAGVPLTFEQESPAPVELLKAIEEHVLILSQFNAQALANLFYRIDVPENDWIQAMEESVGQHRNTGLILLIIKRELQKVVERRRFNSKN